MLHVMVLLKLGLVQRKVLLFSNSINEGYRLRLFLEAFGIKSAVLNAELPLNSRHHILQVYCCSFAHVCMASLLWQWRPSLGSKSAVLEPFPPLTGRR